MRDVQNYENVILPNRIRELVTRLAEIGLNTARVHVERSVFSNYITLRMDSFPIDMGYRAIVMAVGETKVSDEYNDFNTLLAIEFGAGIHYNQVPNPKSKTLGFGVGTFPGQVHAFEDGWHYWDEEAQMWRFTHGVKATMPMYNASVEIINNVKKVANEVFSR